MGTAEMQEALTVAEAANYLRVDRRTIRKMVRDGDLDGNQKGHVIRVSRHSVVTWLGREATPGRLAGSPP